MVRAGLELFPYMYNFTKQYHMNLFFCQKHELCVHEIFQIELIDYDKVQSEKWSKLILNLVPKSFELFQCVTLFI
jgi:hypothetical protein